MLSYLRFLLFAGLPYFLLSYMRIAARFYPSTYSVYHKSTVGVVRISSFASESQEMLDNLNTLYKKQDLSAIKTLFLAEYRSHGLIYLVRLYSVVQKNIFNIGLSSVLATLSIDESVLLLDNFAQQYDRIPSDTFNTILSRILALKGDHYLVHKLFDRYVHKMEVVQPSTRTINMMLEYARDISSSELFNQYFSLLDVFNLQKDSATYTTAVRSSTNLTQLQQLWNETHVAQAFSPILFRCFLETLGSFGEHGLCLYLALAAAKEQDRSLSYSVFVSSSTGDSLLTALLSSENGHEGSALSTQDYQMLFNGQQLSSSLPPLHEINLLTFNISNRYLLNHTLNRLHLSAKLLTNGLTQSSEQNVSLQCSMKGYSVFFGNLHRIMKKVSMDKSKISELSILRKEVWSHLKANQRKLIDLKISSDNNQSASTDLTPNKNIVIKEWQFINGRVVDAILRCFLSEPSNAKSFWLNELFPLLTSLKKVEVLSKATFDESVARGLEVMIMIAGFHFQADFALEIAKTVKSHSKYIHFESNFRQSLWKSYINGKKLRRQLGNGDGFILQDFLFRSLETSLEIELGVLDQAVAQERRRGANEKRKGISRIRIQFK